MKVVLSDVANLNDTTTARTVINNNSAIIETAFDNTLSRDGTNPNTMSAALDMNSNRILNLPAPLNGSEPLRLSDANILNGGGTIATFPTGGTTGQVLGKNSNVDFDSGWKNSVTSVGLALPADFTITNSPVTTTGTLTGAFANTPTGTGGFVRQTSPALITPALGTPTSGVATNLTGTAAGLTAGNVTTNANLTGDVTSVGNATTLTNAPVIAKVLTGYTSGAGTVAATDSILQAIQKLNGNDATNANLTGPITSVGNATSVASQTGTGSTFVMNTSPTLVTPALGTPASGVATNLTGTASGLTAGNVTTNANLTGQVTSVGNATTIGTNYRYVSIPIVIDGGGSVISTGIKGDVEVPFTGTIDRVTMLADQTGSIVVDIWKDTYANYPPTIADTITAAALPTITTATKSQDSTLTGWTTSITAGDTLRFNVNSVTSITRLALSLRVLRT